MDEDNHYNPIRTAQDDILPDFTSAAKGEDAKDKTAAGSLGSNEAEASKSSFGEKDAKDGEENPEGLYSGKGKESPLNVGKSLLGSKGKLLSKMSAGKISAGGFALVVVAIFGIGAITIGSPIYMIGALDGNLKSSLGYDDTMALLEEEAVTVTEEMTEEGRVPRKYFNDLAKTGIEIGQVTASGDFVRTNTYIANIDELDDVAAVYEDYNLNGEKGELSIRFNGEIVEGSKFAATVKANPKMYAAFSEAADIKARYYYSEGVRKSYEKMGLSRNAFAQWESTGDSEADAEAFDEILKSVLDKEVSVNMGGCDGDCSASEVSGEDEVESIIDNASSNAGATDNAAQLLNSALSAEEPYRAAAAFMAIEEPIQRTMIQGDGPVHEVMNVLNSSSEVEYYDVNAEEMTEADVSILGTNNFAAAVSDNIYSYDEAVCFSRDKILRATEAGDSIIPDTVAALEDSKKSGIAVLRGSGGVDNEVISKAESGVAIGLSESNYELFNSIVGGNRIVEGGSFINNMINAQNIGAMPSDEGAIAKHHQAAKTILARKIEAERATKSPFDISSKHTFLGSITHGLATSLLKNSALSPKSLTLSTTMNSVFRHTKKSLSGLVGEAIAEDDGDTFTTIAGDCSTVKEAANVEGDLYCNAHNTVSVDYLDYKKEDWEEEKLDDKEDFVLLAMDREVTPGISSATICEKWREKHASTLEKIFSGIADLLGVYNACASVENDAPGIANGAAYTISEDNENKDKVELYSGYFLYDTVSALLNEEQSETSRIRESYYAKHPQDNSPAGRLARRSGLTRHQAQIAINYSNYLTRIAKYDPSNKQIFGAPKIKTKKNVLIENNNKIAETTYYFWREKTLYSDLRNRNFVA